MRKFEKISKEQWSKDEPNFNYNDIQLPRRSTSKSAGYDLYSPIRYLLLPGEKIKIPSGLKVQMDDDDVMLIVIRSSLGIKKDIVIPNQVSVIDADYYNNEENEGHFWICLKNNSNQVFRIDVGDRISQAIFLKYEVTVDDEPVSNVRKGGIGSTN